MREDKRKCLVGQILKRQERFDKKGGKERKKDLHSAREIDKAE